ncbi:hypothetical protein BT69DRAFT_1294348 [Atractiella rhizophila]|nr:hypothetical protein BT69DRAFT_1294348 [Atractiella rhizophila]
MQGLSASLLAWRSGEMEKWYQMAKECGKYNVNRGIFEKRKQVQHESAYFQSDAEFYKYYKRLPGSVSPLDDAMGTFVGGVNRRKSCVKGKLGGKWPHSILEQCRQDFQAYRTHLSEQQLKTKQAEIRVWVHNGLGLGSSFMPAERDFFIDQQCRFLDGESDV